MVIDCHVHIAACTPQHGRMSDRLFTSLPFRFMRFALGLDRRDEATERKLEQILAKAIRKTRRLDAAVILAFDAVHDEEGRRDDRNTHLYVTNDYVIDLVKRHPNMLFGASVHPYRKDAVKELERCIAAGAVLVKWLAITQNFDPSDERCFPLYEVMAHHKVPLLSHTGGEQSLPQMNQAMADPMLLVPALKRGVTVIAAHCGTRSRLRERDFLPEFVKLAHEYEHCYGDTSALSLPTRSYAYRKILDDPVVRAKLVHGSDWPILPVPPLAGLGIHGCLGCLCDGNWIRRDVRIKEKLGFDDDYWHRTAKVLGPRLKVG